MPGDYSSLNTVIYVQVQLVHKKGHTRKVVPIQPDITGESGWENILNCKNEEKSQSWMMLIITNTKLITVIVDWTEF